MVALTENTDIMFADERKTYRCRWI